jgi:hypothetical protein
MAHPWFFLVTAAGALVFLCFCWHVDKYGGESDSFLQVVLRLIGRHFKLAVKTIFFVFVVIAAFFAILGAAVEGSSNIHVRGGSARPASSGTASGTFFRFANTVTAPVRWVIESTMGILAVLAILLSVLLMGDGPGDSFLDRGIFGECIAHPFVSVPIMLILYLVWLVFNAYDIAASEMWYPSGVPSDWSSLTDEERKKNTIAVVTDRFKWSLRAIAVWAAIVGGTVMLAPIYWMFLSGGYGW